MASDVPERLVRDMACTPADLVRWLPAAVGNHPLRWLESGCEVVLGEGRNVRLGWQVLAPRRIALMRIERVQLEIAFSGCDAETRRVFLDRFDAYTRRGGG
jgi:hypothetical protein